MEMEGSTTSTLLVSLGRKRYVESSIPSSRLIIRIRRTKGLLQLFQPQPISDLKRVIE